MTALRRISRQLWREEAEALQASPSLTDVERAAIRPVLRRWCVARAATRVSLLRYAKLAMIVLDCGAVLVPAVLVLTPALAAQPSLSGRALAFAMYLTVFGVFCVLYSPFYNLRLLRRLAIFGVAAAVMVGGFTVAIGADTGMARTGLVAGLLSALSLLLSHTILVTVNMYLVVPWHRRPMGRLTPAGAVAVELFHLLRELEKASGTWRLPSTRTRLLDEFEDVGYWLDNMLPRVSRAAGMPGAAHRESVKRYRLGARFVDRMGAKLLDAADRPAFAEVASTLAPTTASIAAGDWTGLEPGEGNSRRPLTAAVLRRLVAPAILVGVAVLLPSIPGVTVSGDSLTGVRAALVIAAALSVTSLDSSHRDRILGMFGDPSGRD